MLTRIDYIYPNADLNEGWTAYPVGTRYTAIDEGYLTPDTSDYISASGDEAVQQIGFSAPVTVRIGETQCIRVWFAYRGDVGTVGTPALTIDVYTQEILRDTLTINADTDGADWLAFYDFDLEELTAADAADVDVYFTYIPTGGEEYDPPTVYEVI